MHVRKFALPLVGLAAALPAGAAYAGPWIPPAGAGTMKPVIRFYHSDRAFPPSSFGTQTIPSSTQYDETQIKITGEHGLGGGWALQYDLRAAKDSKTKTKHGTSTTHTAFGLQDQEIGVVRGLRQGNSFADTFALNIVVPAGSTSSTPELGVGHTAVEPEYQFGFRGRFGQRPAYASFSLGPRVFLNSGVTQWRATADVGARLLRRVEIFGTLFCSRTFGANSASASNQNPNAAEDYNLVRAGVGLKFALTRDLRPIIEYESDLAGQSIHAGDRIELGVSWRY